MLFGFFFYARASRRGGWSLRSSPEPPSADKLASFSSLGAVATRPVLLEGLLSVGASSVSFIFQDDPPDSRLRGLPPGGVGPNWVFPWGSSLLFCPLASISLVVFFLMIRLTDHLVLLYHPRCVFSDAAP